MTEQSDKAKKPTTGGVAAVLQSEVKARTVHPGVHVLGGIGKFDRY
jgi:hypothetical protein